MFTSKKLRVLIVLVLSIWVGFSVLVFSAYQTQRQAQGHIDEAKDDLTALLRANEIPVWFLQHADKQFEVGKNVRHQLMVQNAPAAIRNYESQERPNLQDPETLVIVSKPKMTIVIADQLISVAVTDLCDPDIRLIVAHDTTRYVLLGEDCGPLISLIQQFAAEREMNFQMDTTSLAAPGITRMKLPRTADRPN